MRTRTQKGFTLVELLVGMGLMAGFLLILTNLFVSISQVKLESESTSSVTQDGQYLLNKFSYDIQQATAITTPATLGASGSTLALTIGEVTNTYALSGTNLTLTNNNGTNTLNSSETKVNSISFQRLGNGTTATTKDQIVITFTLESQAKRNKGSTIKTFTTMVGRK